MRQKIFWLLLVIAVIALDQLIKSIILGGFRWHSEALSIVLVYNDGVAFSMLAFLQGYLKWLQIGFIALIVGYIFTQREIFARYWLGFGLMIGGGISNVIDRFVHGGVVDYVYWHYWFDFAIFNFADVMIDIGVACLIIAWLIHERRQRRAVCE
ncbi:signal peptidase II [Helicobacter sp. CLO-3]|uniref:signal peptidase II n=1 Tax=unclassified Helicobacter TaxID=2593540 RepID=UPI000804C0CB|nr:MULTISPECIES: signal peptidase II [unclassified Helicobacter]OBV29350.1 signal peptidase II [Helicobacter sp. CLO-3]OHU82608.1 signal peptidase II [Helicobacter sp. CLO-3]